MNKFIYVVIIFLSLFLNKVFCQETEEKKLIDLVEKYALAEADLNKNEETDSLWKQLDSAFSTLITQAKVQYYKFEDLKRKCDSIRSNSNVFLEFKIVQSEENNFVAYTFYRGSPITALNYVVKAIKKDNLIIKYDLVLKKDNDWTSIVNIHNLEPNTFILIENIIGPSSQCFQASVYEGLKNNFEKKKVFYNNDWLYVCSYTYSNSDPTGNADLYSYPLSMIYNPQTKTLSCEGDNKKSKAKYLNGKFLLKDITATSDN